MKTPQIPQNLMIAEQSIIHAVKMGDGQTNAGIFDQNTTIIQLLPPVIAAQGGPVHP